MTISYDTFEVVFLAKISEYDLLELSETDRNAVVDGYLKQTISNSTFRKVCEYDFLESADDTSREFTIDDMDENDLDEIVGIVSDGMLVQWLKQFVYQQDLLHNQLNTRDYTLYSPAELILRIGNAYSKAQSDYIQGIREYSYNHGDLTTLHI